MVTRLKSFSTMGLSVLGCTLVSRDEKGRVSGVGLGVVDEGTLVALTAAAADENLLGDLRVLKADHLTTCAVQLDTCGQPFISFTTSSMVSRFFEWLAQLSCHAYSGISGADGRILTVNLLESNK